MGLNGNQDRLMFGGNTPGFASPETPPNSEIRVETPAIRQKGGIMDTPEKGEEPKESSVGLIGAKCPNVRINRTKKVSEICKYTTLFCHP